MSISTSCTCTSPDRCSRGRSICVTSPVTTTFEPNPSRVRNICICSGEVFCASSRMMKLSFSVRPRMNASGATSIVPALDQVVRAVGVEHVVERVEERTQVRVDLRHQVAGQEPEPLPRLDRGAREDDPRDLALVERRDRERHREVGLARPGRADPEGDGRPADRVDVALLHDRLRRDLLAAVAPDDLVEDLADVRSRPRARRAPRRRCARRSRGRPRRARRARRARSRASATCCVVAFERQLVAAQPDGAVEPLAQRVEHAVGDPRQLGGDGVGDVERVLHPGLSVGRAPELPRDPEADVYVPPGGAEVVDAARGLHRDLHAPAGHHDRERRAAGDRALARRLVLRSPVGRRRLRARARDLRPDRGLARRPVRPQAAVRDRDRAVHGRLGRLRRSRTTRCS